MNKSKAVGPDSVSLEIIRKCFPVLGPHLLHVINHSINTGTVPCLWKQATVVPIFKNGSTSEPSNYRPISILSAVGKLTEKVVSMQLLDYITSNHILSESQYAYRPHHSTLDAITELTSCATKNMDDGRITSVTSTDLSKAFDCVNRNLLLTKLECYGIAEHWFKDYFTNRTQTVTGGQTKLEVPVGVVQGSILGPIMFLLFTNDMHCYVSKECRIISYADDTQLMHSEIPNPHGLTKLKERVEADLLVLSRWFQRNGLKLNPSKTELLIMGTPTQTKNSQDFKVNMSDVVLKPSGTLKILGVTMDKNLGWEPQTAKIVGKCYSKLIAINKLRYIFPKRTLKTLVETLVLPHVCYCLPAWAPPTVHQRQRIGKAMNFAVRIITGKKRHAHISEGREALGWLSIDKLIHLHDCALIHRILNEPE